MTDQQPPAAPGDPYPSDVPPAPAQQHPDAGLPSGGGPYPDAAYAGGGPYPDVAYAGGGPYPDVAYPGGGPYADAAYQASSSPASAYPMYTTAGYGYGYGAPAYVPAAGAPYGYDPVSGQPWSEKSRTTAGLLSLLLPFVGVCGVGRLYAGQIGLGLAQLLGFFLGGVLVLALVGFVIAPAIWLWSVVDGIVLLANGGRDGYGRPLR